VAAYALPHIADDLAKLNASLGMHFLDPTSPLVYSKAVKNSEIVNLGM